MTDCFFKDKYKECQQYSSMYFIYTPKADTAKIFAFCERHGKVFSEYPDSYEEITEEKYLKLKVLI